MLKGYQGQLFIGAAGATGATQLLNVVDVSESHNIETGETTVRGDGTAVPIKYEEVVCRERQITFQMLVKDGDTALATLIAAADAGTPLALRTKNKAAGVGFDGDVNLSYSNGRPLKGIQTMDFTCTLNNVLREAQFNV